MNTPLPPPGLLPDCPASDRPFATECVERLLAWAQRNRASDLQIQPTGDDYRILARIDGVMRRLVDLPREAGPRVVARLKVLAELLTYETERPQEGRIRGPETAAEIRVSTFPTVFGEKAAVRLFVGSGGFRTLDDLRLPADVLAALRASLMQPTGLILIAGPAGSGKTTTAYACLRELLRQGADSADKSAVGRNLVTLEDPVEAILPGASQSQVQTAAGFDLATGLRSLLRQDPEVIFVGEIRDRTVAEIVMQAALTGHLLLTTFHAGSAAAAVSRLLDMGIEPYVLRSALTCLAAQRLMRTVCCCAAPEGGDLLGLPVARSPRPQGCAECLGSGYSGRMVVAEWLSPSDTALGRSILARRPSGRIEARAVRAGMVPLRSRALAAVEEGRTTAAEFLRVFGRAGEPGLPSGP